MVGMSSDSNSIVNLTESQGWFKCALEVAIYNFTTPTTSTAEGWLCVISLWAFYQAYKWVFQWISLQASNWNFWWAYIGAYSWANK